MPRYFFHLRDRQVEDCESDLLRDEEGQDFTDLSRAKVEALASLCDIAAEAIRGRRQLGISTIEIADEAGAILAQVGADDFLEYSLGDAAKSVK